MERLIEQLQDDLVNQLKEGHHIQSRLIEEAFRKVARHLFIHDFYLKDRYRCKFNPINPKEGLLKQIYKNQALTIKVQGNRYRSSSTQPSLMASMLEGLELKKGMNVLEIGTGTGYNAALISEIVGEEGSVTTIEIEESLAQQAQKSLKDAGYDHVKVVARDGFFGYTENAPYERIIVTVGCPDISLNWLSQLSEKGLMLIPLQHGGEIWTPVLKLRKENGRFAGELLQECSFMAIQGNLALEVQVDKAVAEFLSKFPVEDKAFLENKFLMESYDLFDGLGNWERLYSFVFFVMLHDERTFIRWGAAGLWDKRKGVLMILPEAILLYGNNSLYQDLERLYQHWKVLGRPGLKDYRFEFLFEDPLNVQRASFWVIRRKFSKELVRLK